MKRYLPFAIIAGVFLIAAGGGTLFYFSERQPVAQAATSIGRAGAEPPHVRGPANASVCLEEFGDFQCPPCIALFPVLKKVESDYGVRLCVTFRQFPLAVHRRALEAARAAEAAGLQGRFWEMHDVLYQNGWVWSRVPDPHALFAQFAQTLGLDVERFKRDMESEQVNSRIISDQQRGASLHVDRTPVLFINNRRVPIGALNASGLHAEIDAVLNPKTH